MITSCQQDSPAATTTAAPPTAAAVTPAARSSTSTTPTACTATKAARLAGLGLVDDELASVHLKAVQGVDGFLALFIVGHLDETEAARAPGFAVDDDRRPPDLSVLGEQAL